MEDMEIDQIVDVPDTPDRLTTRHGDQKYVGIAKSRRLAFRPQRNIYSDKMSDCHHYTTVSPLERSHPCQNGSIFRRSQTDGTLGHGTAYSNGAERMEKGKTINLPSKSSHHGPISVLDLTEENGQPQKLKPTFSHRGTKYSATEEKKELKASSVNSSSPFISGSSNISVDHGKSIALSNDSQSQTEKQVPPRFHSPPRARGHKRLVRNGCISPHNIATMAKQSAEQNTHQINYLEQSHDMHSVSSSTMSPITVDDIIAGGRGRGRGSGRVKGKEVVVHPSSSGRNSETIHTSSSRPVINYEEANGTHVAIRNPHKYSEGHGGWRTTNNHRKNADQHLCDVNGHHLNRNDDVGSFSGRRNANRMDRRDVGSSQSLKEVHGSPSDHATQVTSLIIPEVGQSTGTRPTIDTLNKRLRKHGSTSRDPCEASYDSDIMFLSSSGESSISSSSRRLVLDPEVVELLPETGSTHRVSHDSGDMHNNDSDALARQVEADEILARELQEQLFHEDPLEVGEIDERLAWELQHAEDLLHTSIDSQHISHPTWLARAPSNRQTRSRSHQNPSNRRRAVPQVPFSNRASRLRSRIQSQSRTPIISSRGRRPRFPLDMDLDMRLDILEALEDAMGDLSDIGVTDDIFHAHRDFNEDDYEMLLALDEGNHQHTGASANQISSLPQSTIQTDNFTEACAICLETPVKGEIIRHLPCLHKFHKDCIDPWLHRNTSCPVCKSSIT